jgi:hypothetical protein
MHKRGQFFIIATVIIIIALIGAVTIYNNASSPKEDSKVFDLSTEMQFEGSQVIDSSVFNALSSTKTDEYIKNLTDYYAQLNPDSDILIVYGNGSAIQYTCDPTGSVGLGQSSTKSCERTTQTINPQRTSETITVKFINDTIEREFQLRPDNNFYIILKREKSDTTTIVGG